MKRIYLNIIVLISICAQSHVQAMSGSSRRAAARAAQAAKTWGKTALEEAGFTAGQEVVEEGKIISRRGLQPMGTRSGAVLPQQAIAARRTVGTTPSMSYPPTMEARAFSASIPVATSKSSAGLGDVFGQENKSPEIVTRVSIPSKRVADNIRSLTDIQAAIEPMTRLLDRLYAQINEKDVVSYVGERKGIRRRFYGRDSTLSDALAIENTKDIILKKLAEYYKKRSLIAPRIEMATGALSEATSALAHRMKQTTDAVYSFGILEKANLDAVDIENLLFEKKLPEVVDAFLSNQIAEIENITKEFTQKEYDLYLYEQDLLEQD